MLNFWKTIQTKKNSTLSNNVGLSVIGNGFAPLIDFEYEEIGM